MGNINVLPFEVANLIAAGEVVDRPASLVKELLENSIDSGADRITVEIKHGGVTFIRVSDNGCGISAEDMPVAVKRHATSKIREASDLDGILTLGFRGEALAAISAVCDMRIISKTKNSHTGTILASQDGIVKDISERACADGTSVIVENLFANVPARRKFLKKDSTETMAINAVVEKIALSKPKISFKFIVDETLKLETVGDGSLKSAVYGIFGREFASKLLEVDFESEGVRITGFIGRPDNVRANRNMQNFFINGRYIKSFTASAAIEQAFTSYIPSDKFPCCILRLDLNPKAVDVNVHPAKLEVKFSNEKIVFDAVYYAVRNAVENNISRPEVNVSAAFKPAAFIPKVSEQKIPIRQAGDESLKKRQLEGELFLKNNVADKISEKSVPENVKDEHDKAFIHITAEEYVKQYTDGKIFEDKRKVNPVSETKPEVKSEKSAEIRNNYIQTEKPKSETRSERMDYRIVGEVFNSYIIVELKEKLIIIDKHAAHERIIFEKLKSSMKNRSTASQLLMIPLEVMMTSEEIGAIKDFAVEIEACGFEFSVGRHTVSVSAIPDEIDSAAVPDMLATIADRAKSGTGNAQLTKDIIFEKALYQAACKAAVKAGRAYPDGHIKWIADSLMTIPDITVCPHGRPVAVEISKRQLDKQVERPDSVK